MRVRDLQYDAYDSVFVLSPVSRSVLDAIEQGLVELVGSPLGAALRRSWPRRGSRLSVAAARRLAPLAIRVADDTASDEDLIAGARNDGYRGLPITVTVAGDRLVVAFAHVAADGGGMVRLLHALLAAALGRPDPDPVGPRARLPLLRAAISAGPSAFLALRASRAEAGVEPVAAQEPTAAQAALGGARMLSLRLDGDEVRRIRRAKRGAGRGRATLSTRVASLALAALQATYLRQEDVRVAVPVDLRHHVRGRVDGNFVSTAPLGGLRSTAWTPTVISERTAVMAGPIGAASQVLSVLRYARSRSRIARPWREHAVTVSVLAIGSLPDGSWADPAAATIACASIGPWPSAVFVFVGLADDRVHLSVWDEAGVVDLDRYRSAFEAELTQREGVDR